MHDFGIRCLIAPSLGDIFHGNFFKNGMLPITLAPEAVARLFDTMDATPGFRLNIDLTAQTVTLPDGAVRRFEIDAERKRRLLGRLDDIPLTLQRADRIRAYEAQRRLAEPWLFA